MTHPTPDDDLMRVTPMAENQARSAAHARLIERGVFAPLPATDDAAEGEANAYRISPPGELEALLAADQVQLRSRK